jgi:hypothetical protein
LLCTGDVAANGLPPATVRSSMMMRFNPRWVTTGLGSTAIVSVSASKVAVAL